MFLCCLSLTGREEMNVKLEYCVEWKQLLYDFVVTIVDDGGVVGVSAISNPATIVMAVLHRVKWRLS